LQKAFENRQDGPWPAFKSSGRCTASCSKENCLIGKIFDGFQNHWVDSDRLSKVLGAAPRNFSSNRSKGFELADFEKLFAN
jgi:hypothetical protein